VVERQMLNVPALVGQPVDIAQETVANLGFRLAAGDPDGPGLRSTRSRELSGKGPCVRAQKVGIAQIS
jgi:hypothetical protein